MDPFATLGIARSYDVDLRRVEKAHRDLSRAVHPDRFIGASATERREAMARAIDVNEAWRTVRDPIRRAQALLTLHGVTAGEDAEPKPSPQFLMDMLEQREALSEAKGAGDLDAVRCLAGAVRARAFAVEREIASGLEAGADGSVVGKLGELRFYQRFLDEVGTVLDEVA